MIKKCSTPKTILLIVVLLNIANIQSFATVSSPNKGFRENKGQISDQHFKPRHDILFSGTDGKLVYHLKQNGISYQLSKVKSWKKAESFYPNKKFTHRTEDNQATEPDEINIYRVDINWLNCIDKSFINKGEALEGYDNFYTDACPQGALEVRRYKDVTYKNLYSGIDLKWYEKNGQLKYDYNISVGADYTQIKLEINGAEKMSINNKGQLIIKTLLGELIEDAPIVIQDGKTLPSSWKINGNIISFQITGINSKKPFTIDPLVRLWGTFYGGNGYDWVGTNYTDATGNLYITGGTTSSNLQTIATTGAFQTTYGGSTNIFGDVFLVKFNSNGQRLWGTYFGSTGIDFGYACTVDGNGDVYITGGTTSTNSAVMTTSGAYQTTYLGGSANNTGDALLAKFSSAGQRLWSTYFGEIGNEVSNSVTCDALGNVIITGLTGSTSNTFIASAGAHQTNFGGGMDCFLAKFSTSGARLWSTYYGGSGDEQAFNCITNAAGDIYIGGVTSSTNSISTPGSHQANYGGSATGIVYGIGDAFVAKFNASGQRQWGTYYGGSGDEGIYYLALDVFGNLYFSGGTSTSTGTVIATAVSHQSVYGGGSNDAMLVKFDPSGVRQWGTYYGGANIEEYSCCFIEKGSGYIYLSGNTGSGGTNIATPCSYQPTIGGSRDAFLVKFDLLGNRLWGTYYGGTGIEDWSALTVDGLGSVYLCGETNSSSSANATVIASPGAHQTSYGGGTYDAFIVKFDACTPVAPPALSNSIACKGQSAVLASLQQCGINWYSDAALTQLISSNSIFTTGIITGDTTFYYVDVSCGLPSVKSVATLSVVSGPSVSISASHSLVCRGESSTLTPIGAINYSWTGVQSTYSVVVSPSITTIYTVSGSNFNGGCANKATKTIVVKECVGLNENISNSNFYLNVYPNPSNGSITLSGIETLQITISNDLGQVLRSIELSEVNQFKTQVNDLPDGLYFISVITEKTTHTSKIIVQK